MKSLTKIIVICTVGFLGTLALWLFLLSPMLNQVSILNTSIQNKKSQSAQLDQQILAFQTAQASLSKATRKDDIMTAIPNKSDLVESVGNLESAATASKLITETLDIQENNGQSQAQPTPLITGENGVTEVPYQATGQGDYLGMISFLSYLEHLPHFTEVSNVQLTAITQGNPSSGVVTYTGQITGTFNGVFFTQTNDEN